MNRLAEAEAGIGIDLTDDGVDLSDEVISLSGEGADLAKERDADCRCSACGTESHQIGSIQIKVLVFKELNGTITNIEHKIKRKMWL